MNKNMLMISNSFGVNLQTYLNQISKCNGDNLDIYVLYIGGCSLEVHWNNIINNSSSYELFHNGATTSKMISIKDALCLFDHWDFISLQQASHLSGVQESFEPYLNNLINYIKDNSSFDKLLWHKTWAYSKYNPVRYKEEWLPFHTHDDMLSQLNDCYDKYIKNNSSIYKTIDSCKVIEIAAEQQMNIFDDLGFHMNLLGSYLIGLNAYKTLFNNKINNVFYPDGLNKNDVDSILKLLS